MRWRSTGNVSWETWQSEGTFLTIKLQAIREAL